MQSQMHAHNVQQEIVIPDIISAIYDYIEAFSDIDPNNIFLAPANRLNLPRQTNHFALLSVLSSTPTSTNKKSITYQDDTDIQTTATLKKFVVQIDIYGNSVLQCMESMNKVHMLWRDAVGYDFLAARHVNPLYVSDIRHSHEVDASDQFVERLSADFTLCAWEYSNAPVQTFSHVKVKACINVDAMSQN